MPTTSGERSADRVAYVTGAGGGIGYQVAQDLLDSGASVVAIDLKAPPDELTDHQRCVYLQRDVADPASAPAAMTTVRNRYGRLDYVVNAAAIGLFEQDRGVEDTPPEIWQRVLDVNLTAAAHLVRAALPLMLGSGGCFVHVSSIAGLRNADGAMDAYQVSKAGLSSLSRAVALRHGPAGIRSNTVCPGAVLTPMVEPLYRDDESRKQRMIERTPLRRLASPGDIANACMFLLSDRASFITGIDLIVDGGWLLRM